MPQQLRESKWTYNTAATSGIGIEMLSASSGTIVLTDPSQQDHSFSYAGFGIGFISVPIPKIKLPPIPLLNREIGANGAAKSFYGGGVLYMTSSFHGQDLAKSDMQGGTVYLDGNTGLLVGYGGSVMLLGINTAYLAPWLLNPGIGGNLAANAIQNAPALLLMHGQTEGLIASIAGISAMPGYLH
jgi:hypothetical protein